VSTNSPPQRTPGGMSISAFVPVAALTMIVALWAALIYAPTERIEGDMQRMFYLHVPAAFTMFLAYGIMTLASVIYLVRREDRWDEAAAAAASVATLFGTVVLLTGPVWAKPIWGTWWTWDARLTSTLVLWLILIAYQMLRQYGGSPEQVARYCAVLAVIGFADLPIIHYSVKWWRTMHPDPKIMTEGSIGQGLAPSMLLAFALGMLATLLFFGVVLGLRLQLERQSRRLAGLQELLRAES
jgi:heme exporter protein C